jgi:hypothetical protein
MGYVGKHGIVRPRDLEAIGLPREYLVRLRRQGKLNQHGRGIYTLPNANVTEHHSTPRWRSESRMLLSACFRLSPFTRSRLRVLLQFGSPQRGKKAYP